MVALQLSLYSDDGAVTVCPSINTAAHLAKTQRDHPDDAMVYKFATPEWRFEMIWADAEFDAICDRVRGHVMTQDGSDALPRREFAKFRGALFEPCLRGLESLRRERAFKDVLLVYAVSEMNFSIRTELARIKRLNPKPVVDEFWAWTRKWDA